MMIFFYKQIKKVINKISIKSKIENSKTKYSCAGVIKMSDSIQLNFLTSYQN